MEELEMEERIDRFTIREAPEAIPGYEDPFPLQTLSQVLNTINQKFQQFNNLLFVLVFK